MTEHLGHDKNQAPPDRESTNIRNGTRPTAVLSEASGHVPIDVPRDREGAFERQIARETITTIERGRRDRIVVVCQRINDRWDQFVFRRNLSLQAGCPPGASVSKGTISEDYGEGVRGARGDAGLVCPSTRRGDAAFFVDAIAVKVRRRSGRELAALCRDRRQRRRQPWRARIVGWNRR